MNKKLTTIAGLLPPYFVLFSIIASSIFELGIIIHIGIDFLNFYTINDFFSSILYTIPLSFLLFSLIGPVLFLLIVYIENSEKITENENTYPLNKIKYSILKFILFTTIFFITMPKSMISIYAITFSFSIIFLFPINKFSLKLNSII